MVTSAWVPQKTIMTPGDKWDPQEYFPPSTMQVWDFKERKIIQTLNGEPITIVAALDARTPASRHGYSISFAGNSIWAFPAWGEDGTFTHKKADGICVRAALPADMRQSPDDLLHLHQLLQGQRDPGMVDFRDPKKIKFHDSIQGVVQPNMMHMTGDGRRLYFTNSALSTTDYSPRYAMQLIQGRDWDGPHEAGPRTSRLTSRRRLTGRHARTTCCSTRRRRLAALALVIELGQVMRFTFAGASRVLSLLVVAAACAGASAGSPRDPALSANPSLAVIARAPDFVLRDASGEAVRLSSYRGRVVLLAFGLYELLWSRLSAYHPADGNAAACT